jgi:hypothetical protein
MGPRLQRTVLWSLLGAIGIWVIWFELWPRSVLYDTPFMRELSRIHEIGGNITAYYTNKALAGGDIDGLLASKVISPDDAAYIRDHRIQFYGFDPARIAGDIPVFETICTNTSPPRRIIGYSDGSTSWHYAEKKD